MNDADKIIVCKQMTAGNRDENRVIEEVEMANIISKIQSGDPIATKAVKLRRISLILPFLVYVTKVVYTHSTYRLILKSNELKDG
jgi:hypothetical protein